MKQYTEDNLQSEAYLWINNTYCLAHHTPRLTCFSVPNGGTRNPVEAKKLQATGLRPGVADFLVCMPPLPNDRYGRLLFIEFKLPNGVQSDVQRKFQSTVQALGFEYKIIRSLEEFKEYILCKLQS